MIVETGEEENRPDAPVRAKPAQQLSTAAPGKKSEHGG